MEGLEMEKRNFDNEAHEEIESVTQALHGFLSQCRGSKAFYQPWGAHGRPLTNTCMTTFNVSVWLLYKMTGRNLSTDAILELTLRLSLPSDVAGHMLLFALR